MYKVILIDDDELVRVGLETVFSFNSKGFQVVDSLSSGAQALASIQREQPDVIITDLYMPELDGLQLIRQCKQICPDAIIVVLSCHNDLESIKESIHLGAFDYQLKSSIVDPKNADVLLERIAAACEMRATEKKSEQGKQAYLCRKQTVLSFIQESDTNLVPVQQALLRMGFDVFSEHLFLVGLQLDNYDSIVGLVDNEKALLHKIEKYMDEQLEIFGNGLCMYARNGLFLLLLQIESVTAAIPPRSRLMSICERLRSNMKNTFLRSCSIYIGKNCELKGIPRAYQNLMQELLENRGVNFDMVVDLEAKPPCPHTVEADTENDSPYKPVENVIRYIEANFTAPLTLDELAREANFSKYHLCRKFKEATGVSIVDYIQRCRIERAKELLKKPGDRYIFNIAREVGFNDASYFNRIFKKYTSFTPNEYQKTESRDHSQDPEQTRR